MTGALDDSCYSHLVRETDGCDSGEDVWSGTKDGLIYA